MIQKITEDELRFAELLHDPIAVIENLVPKNHDAPSTWSKEEECIRIRLYQIPTLSYEYLVADDPKKTEQENFDLKKSAGQGYNIGGRKFGKSFVTIFCDALLTIIHYTGKIVVLASFDSKHLKTRMEEICNYVSLHPFFKIFHLKGVKIDTVSRSPYKIQMRHGLKFYGINENIYGKNPGTDYHQHHYHKFIYEEASYESETGHTKRVDSTSELGAIERLSGIPDVTDSSYLGQVLNNPKKKGEVIRLPQYVRFNWTDEAKNNAIEEYDGEGSIDYKLNVDGIKIEGAHGIFDMERVKDCFNDQKQVKVFQISKDDIKDLDDSEFKEVLKNKIIIDKIPSEFKYICADIGDGNAPTEIIIVYKLDEKYIYSYNITLNSLTDDEQYKVFKWLYDKLDGAFIGLDCTDGTGRAIYRELAKKIGTDHLVYVHFNKNMTVGFEEKDGKIVRDKNKKATLKQENTMNWADKTLKKLLYKKRIELYMDEKFYKQFSSYKIVNGKRKTSKHDHLLQAFQVFAITHWNKESKKAKKKRRITGVGAV